MGMVVPNTLEQEILTSLLTSAMTLRIFGNNATPIGVSIAGDFTEIAGGGYANKPLILANWVITPGDPTIALYNTQQAWTFTGPINAPGTIYGYYVTRNSDGKLMWAERFASGVVPFTPIAGSIIKVTPKFIAQSLF
jgi:hypothetical protein